MIEAIRRYRPDVYIRLSHEGANSDLADTITVAQIIRGCLIDFGVAFFPNKTLPNRDWYCFVASVPDGPNNTICVKDSVGRLFGRGARTGKNLVHPGVQIMVRSRDEVLGFRQANRIAEALDTHFPVLTYTPEDGSPHRIQSIYRTSPIIPLGEEVGKKRNMWALNARVVFEYDEPSLG